MTTEPLVPVPLTVRAVAAEHRRPDPAVPLAAALGGDDAVARAAAEAEALYLHVPFCAHKCHYCDFYSLVDARDRRDAFTDRLVAEIRWFAARARRPLASIFVGGGTPTLLSADAWCRVLEAIAELPRVDGLEFTVEANPETIDPRLARTLAQGGVGRASLGAQSFDPRHLRTLERRHDPASVGRAVEMLREAGIANLNLDLIFGIPGQALDDLEADLERVLALAPEHVSCYGLTYEPGTALEMRRRRGEIVPVDEDLEATMYERVRARLANAGFEQYEVSNWARPGRACRHNLLYWENASWWAIGPSAAAHADGARWRGVPRLDEWLEHGPPARVTDVERAGADVRAGEAFMVGLRVLAGIPEARVESLLAAPGGTRRRAAIEHSIARGLLERAEGRLRLTGAGLLVADAILAELLAAHEASEDRAAHGIA